MQIWGFLVNTVPLSYEVQLQCAGDTDLKWIAFKDTRGHIRVVEPF